MSTTNQETLDRLQAIRQKREPKKQKPLRSVGLKRQAELDAEKKERGDGDTLKEQWFQARRKEMTGVCGCGCGEPSCKHDPKHFRSSIAHIMPKDQENGFPSVMYHPLNWVERRIWGGCHTNMDTLGLNRWPNMEDWPVIRGRFLILEPLLTPEEKTRKFYHKLKELVENNP